MVPILRSGKKRYSIKGFLSGNPGRWRPHYTTAYGRAGRATSVPQIWIGEQHIGGCDQLYGLERSGGLDPCLRKSQSNRHDFDTEGEPAWLKKEQQPLRKQPHNSNLSPSGFYTKDISFRVSDDAERLPPGWKFAVNVDLNTKSSRVDEGNHEVVLTLTITAKLEEQTAFLVEVQQAGIFFVAGIEGDALRQLLSTVAPTILFPYAREAIDNLVVKGGFPALMIAPVNFDALFRQAVAQQAAEAGEDGDATEDGEAAPEGATH